jgi:hypothetical protein
MILGFKRERKYSHTVCGCEDRRRPETRGLVLEVQTPNQKPSTGLMWRRVLYEKSEPVFPIVPSLSQTRAEVTQTKELFLLTAVQIRRG